MQGSDKRSLPFSRSQSSLSSIRQGSSLDPPPSGFEHSSLPSLTMSSSSDPSSNIPTTSTTTSSSSSSARAAAGAALADQWGPALTQAFANRDISTFQALFVSDRPIIVVLQDGTGREAEFTLSDNPDHNATMTWQDFLNASTQDLELQNYVKTEAQCLGVLGNRILLEVGRFNTSNTVYLESYMLVTIDDDDTMDSGENSGKVVAVETFSDPRVDNLVAAAVAGTAEDG